jgi:DNA invertase Pin-like site-specific DNA recombinase
MVAGYIRVSRVGGREGESFISPDVQAESIHRWCTAHSLELGEVVVELDVSGGKTAEERELGRLIEACEAGELEGVVVWNLSRFGQEALRCDSERGAHH